MKKFFNIFQYHQGKVYQSFYIVLKDFSKSELTLSDTTKKLKYNKIKELRKKIKKEIK